MSKQRWQRNVQPGCIITGDICILSQLPPVFASKCWNIKFYTCYFTYKYNQIALTVCQPEWKSHGYYLFFSYSINAWCSHSPSYLLLPIKKSFLSTSSSFLASQFVLVGRFERLTMMRHFFPGFTPFRMTQNNDEQSWCYSGFDLVVFFFYWISPYISVKLWVFVQQCSAY